jgi:hypothetical protein
MPDTTKLLIEKHFTSVILFDLIDYSKLSDDDQFLSIKLLSDSLSKTIRILFGQSFLEIDEILLGIIPTGDGAYLILKHNFADYGLLFALSVRTMVLHVQQRTKGLFQGIRTAVHLGVVIPVQDLTGGKNFVGTGLNNCARLCAHAPSPSQLAQVNCKDQNWVIISHDAYELFDAKYSFPAAMSYRQAIKLVVGDEFEFPDKHEQRHRARLVESSRHVAISPPKPPDIDRRLEKFVKSISDKQPAS